MLSPFVLLDDARVADASPARLYCNAVEIVVARRMEEVAPALERLTELNHLGFDLAGHMAYEAGLALEPRMTALGPARCGSQGPLIWFGAFKGFETLAAEDVPAWLARESGGRSASIGPLEPQVSLGAYGQAFSTLQESISAGDIYQANLTFPLSGAWSGDPHALYAAIRPHAAAGYGGLVFDGSHWLLSFSPELFFSLKGGQAKVKPMKGTRTRGRDATEDKALRDELAGSIKDRAENLMIVDLMRNDLSRISVPGSVQTDQLFAIESYPTVHQMVSTVRGELRPGLGAVDMIRALFPCGSITGAPKIRAMELINQVELASRGAYCGAIGRIDGAGDSAFNVAIRTLRLSSGENGTGRATLAVGSAIVADSLALPEWRECLVKGGFVQRSSGDRTSAGFDLIETMAFTPTGGIPLLEMHLERMKESAVALGFSFDRHALRNAIQALCFDADIPQKLRLMVSASGAYSLELGAMPLPLPDPAVCAVLPLPVDEGDWRLCHKTSDRGFYEAGLKAAKAAGGHEALFMRDDGQLTEGCFTSLFVRKGDVLVTPPLALGLLPGVLRRWLIDQGDAVEGSVRLDDLAEGFFIGNSVRGLMAAKLL